MRFPVCAQIPGSRKTVDVAFANTLALAFPVACALGTLASGPTGYLTDATLTDGCKSTLQSHLERYYVAATGDAAINAPNNVASGVCKYFYDLPPLSCMRYVPQSRGWLEVVSLSISNMQFVFSTALSVVAAALYAHFRRHQTRIAPEEAAKDEQTDFDVQ